MSTVQLETIDHVIGGVPTAGASTRTAPVYDPATGQEQRHVRLAEASDVDAAVQAAKAAFESWSDQSVVRRARVMFAFRELIVQHTDELARIISAEHGKTVEDARGEVVRGMEVVEYACGIAELLKGEFSDQVSTDVDLHSFRQPLGVCAGITPFNFPIMVPMWMHPMAIATGNTFVLEAVRARSVGVELRRRPVPAGRPAGRRVQRRPRRQGGRRRAARPSRRGRDLVRRLDADREVHPRARFGRRQARPGPGRREEPRDRDAGRRPRLRRQPPDGGGLRQRRPALHGDLGGRRGRRRRRRAGRAPAREGARHQGRARPGPGLRDGAGRHRRGPRPRRRTTSVAARATSSSTAASWRSRARASGSARP